MDRPAGSKTSYYDHYKQIEKTTGKKHEKLKASESTPRLFYLWQAYLEVMGTAPLTFSELLAWQQLTAKQLTSLENKLLLQLDRLNKWKMSQH